MTRLDNLEKNIKLAKFHMGSKNPWISLGSKQYWQSEILWLIKKLKTGRNKMAQHKGTKTKRSGNGSKRK